MTPRTVRRLVIVTCIAGIAGMIVSSIADNDAAAMTAGLVTAVAVLCLIVATAVTKPGVAAGSGPADVDTEALGAEIETRIATLVSDGADEQQARDLVREALRLGRTR